MNVEARGSDSQNLFNFVFIHCNKEASTLYHEPVQTMGARKHIFTKIKFNVYCVQVFNSFEKEKFCAKCMF